MKRALITGITGQDGSYLAEFLLNKGYIVFGMERRASQKTTRNIEHLLDKVKLVSGDLLDESSLINVLKETEPNEVYNLGAQSYVSDSIKQPVYTGEVTALGAARLLEAVRQVYPQIKFYQASSSEMFGEVTEVPQNEQTPFRPRNPYGVAKLYAHWMTNNHRNMHNIFAVCGILFNHESPRRGLEFVTRKITNTAVKIKLGLVDNLILGNLDAKRDWGFSGDYVEAMWLMLQQNKPKDYVIGTGETHTVRDFVEETFVYLDLDWKKYVEIDKNLFRPAEGEYFLCADATQAKNELGWKPKVNFKELIKMMVDHDLKTISEQNDDKIFS